MKMECFALIVCAVCFASPSFALDSSFTPDATFECLNSFLDREVPKDFDEFVISPEDILSVELRTPRLRDKSVSGSVLVTITLDRKRSLEWDTFRQDHLAEKNQGISVRLLGRTIAAGHFPFESALYVHCPWKFLIGFNSLDEAYSLMKRLVTPGK